MSAFYNNTYKVKIARQMNLLRSCTVPYSKSGKSDQYCNIYGIIPKCYPSSYNISCVYSSRPFSTRFTPAGSRVNVTKHKKLTTLFFHVDKQNAIIGNHISKQTKTFSSLARIWGTLFTRTNPIVEDIVMKTSSKQSSIDNLFDFTRYEPYHFTDAASHLQSKYNAELKDLEKEIVESNVDANYLIHTIEQMSQPMLTFQNIITLLSQVKAHNNEHLNQALHDASEIVQLNHETSIIIHGALKSIIDSNNLCKEKSICVQYLLRRQRLKGCHLFLDDDTNEKVETLRQLNERLDSLESKFTTLTSYTMEQHGKVTPTQQLLPYLYEIISLKQYKSQLLGYSSYTDYSLDYHSCMAQTKEEISKLHEVFVQEKAIELFGNDDFLSRHYELLDDVSIEPEAVKNYFEFNNVLQKLFSLTSTLFNIKIQEETDSSKVRGWDNDVRLFYVYENDTNDKSDQDGKMKHIASFYIDPYRRVNKQSSEFVVPIVYKSSSTNNVPVVAMSLNIRPPVWDDSPIKLDFNNVVGLFHEFGHVGAFIGGHAIEEDASEVVSQFMEYWLFQSSFLSDLATHCETGEPIPNEIIQKLKERNQSIKRYDLLHRLFLGELELEINSNFDPQGDESIMALQRKYAETYCPKHIPPKGNIDPLIQIFDSNANGKFSVQYRYLWSEVMSADLFEPFQEAIEKSDEVALRKLGRKFRKSYLEQGGIVSTEEAFNKFRGRKVSNEAILKLYGLN